MKTLILDPNSPPHANTMPLDHAVRWNTEERIPNVPHKALAFMLSSLIEELYNRGHLDHMNIGRILSMDVRGIESVEKQPPFIETIT